MGHTSQIQTIILWTLLICGSLSPLLSFTTTDDPVMVDEAMFGYLIKDSNGSLQFRETDRIPKKTGLTYGWRIHIRTDKDLVTWKELFLLPSAPDNWGGEEKEEITISGDRKQSIMIKTVIPENGWISNKWNVSEGDPSGKYVIHVYINGQFAKRFIFHVEETEIQ